MNPKVRELLYKIALVIGGLLIGYFFADILRKIHFGA